MEQNKKGGKRLGAGRKPIPILDKKVTLPLYISTSDILKFGNKEKAVTKLNEFVANYGKEIKITPMTPDAYDGKKIYNLMANEPKMYIETILDQSKSYQEEIRQTTWSGGLAALMKLIKADTATISPKQYLLLEMIAKEHAKDFTN